MGFFKDIILGIFIYQLLAAESKAVKMVGNLMSDLDFPTRWPL